MHSVGSACELKSGSQARVKQARKQEHDFIILHSLPWPLDLPKMGISSRKCWRVELVLLMQSTDKQAGQIITIRLFLCGDIPPDIWTLLAFS